MYDLCMVCEVRPQYETELVSWLTMLCSCVAVTNMASCVTVGVMEQVYVC
jgi:hypothetical protein